MLKVQLYPLGAVTREACKISISWFAVAKYHSYQSLNVNFKLIINFCTQLNYQGLPQYGKHQLPSLTCSDFGLCYMQQSPVGHIIW